MAELKWEDDFTLTRFTNTFPNVDVGWGFPTSENQFPIMERCIKKNDPAEFEEWLKKREERAAKNNEIF